MLGVAGAVEGVAVVAGLPVGTGTGLRVRGERGQTERKVLGTVVVTEDRGGGQFSVNSSRSYLVDQQKQILLIVKIYLRMDNTYTVINIELKSWSTKLNLLFCTLIIKYSF